MFHVFILSFFGGVYAASCFGQTSPSSPFTRSCTTYVVSVPAGQNRCFTIPVYSGYDGGTATASYSGLKGSQCGITGCDKYGVWFGALNVDGTDANCKGIVGVSVKACTADAPCSDSRTWTLEEGTKPVIAIACANRFFTCDIVINSISLEWNHMAPSFPTATSSSSSNVGGNTNSPGDSIAPTIISYSISPATFSGPDATISGTVTTKDTGGSGLFWAAITRSTISSSCTVANFLNGCNRRYLETVYSPRFDGPWTVTIEDSLTRVQPGQRYLYSMSVMDAEGNVAHANPPIEVSRSPATTSSPPAPSSSPSASPPPSSSGECFHIDTEITYKGKRYTYDELKVGKEPECVIPHVVESDGFFISTTDKHRVGLSADHLVKTIFGYTAARLLKKNDAIFLENDEKTFVRHVWPIRRGTFFGLNCLQSSVYADGILTSTFGKYHTIPSLWMAIVGNLAGIEKASQLGDHLASYINSYV